jgi:hypothetical protein
MTVWLGIDGRTTGHVEEEEEDATGKRKDDDT